MTWGAIYIITRDSRYRNLLINSATSLRLAMPELPITVFSEFPVESDVFERVVRVESSGDGFYDKTLFLQQSPYDRTLFIDADTYIHSSLRELFEILDRFDCAATHEEYLNTDWWSQYPRPDIPSSFPEFNTGVLAFRRSPPMDRTLRAWSNLYKTFIDSTPGGKINDQPFFRAAVYENDVRIATLTREYNCKFRGQGYLNGGVRVLHGHVDLRLDRAFVDRSITVLNASSGPRVYVAGKVYEQRLVGRILDRRKAGFVGRFPLLPEPVIVAGAKKLLQMVKGQGGRRLATKVLARIFG